MWRHFASDICAGGLHGIELGSSGEVSDVQLCAVLRGKGNGALCGFEAGLGRAYA
jgi:hypothetical protein